MKIYKVNNKKQINKYMSVLKLMKVDKMGKYQSVQWFNGVKRRRIEGI